MSDVKVQPHLWLHILWWVVQWISADLALVETCLTRCTTSNLWSGIYTHFITQYCCSAYGPHCKFMTFSSAWPIALTHICAPPFLSDQMNYLCRYSVSNERHTWSKEAHRHYLQPSVAHVALQSVPCTTHCYELDVATWPHTDVSCSLYIHCTSYLHVLYTGWWWQTAHSTSLYNAQAVCLCVEWRFTKLAHVTHVFSSHDLQVTSSCISFICSVVGRPAWNSKNEHCTITQHISDIFMKHPTDRAGCVQLRVVSPQHDMYSISHNTLCSTTVKCMTDTQLYCLKFMFLVYTYGVCHVILCTYGVPTVAV